MRELTFTTSIQAMAASELQPVLEQVLNRAERQGHVLAGDIRETLLQNELDPARWSEVVEIAGPSLVLRRRRYHFQSPAAIKLAHDRQRQQDIRHAVRQLIRQHQQAARKVERRGHDRLDFIQPVTVTSEDRRSCRLLSRDLSPTGIRLIGTQRLLGQKVEVVLGPDGDNARYRFMVRILWTCAVADGLFENGGSFLDVSNP